MKHNTEKKIREKGWVREDYRVSRRKITRFWKKEFFEIHSFEGTFNLSGSQNAPFPKQWTTTNSK